MWYRELPIFLAASTSAHDSSVSELEVFGVVTGIETLLIAIIASRARVVATDVAKCCCYQSPWCLMWDAYCTFRCNSAFDRLKRELQKHLHASRRSCGWDGVQILVTTPGGKIH